MGSKTIVSADAAPSFPARRKKPQRQHMLEVLIKFACGLGPIEMSTDDHSLLPRPARAFSLSSNICYALREKDGSHRNDTPS